MFKGMYGQCKWVSRFVQSSPRFSVSAKMNRFFTCNGFPLMTKGAYVGFEPRKGMLKSLGRRGYE
jgi:hypothetical protein